MVRKSWGMMGLAFFWVLAGPTEGVPLKLSDPGTFERPGLSVLIFHNAYPEGHQGGIEIIQHGERIATNGDVRLESTPGQWDPLPVVRKRHVDSEQGRVSVSLSYPAGGFTYTVHVEAVEEGFRVSLELPSPIPEGNASDAGFQIELFPGLYFEKPWILDERFGIFPRQFDGPTDGRVPLPMAMGRTFVAAPSDPERAIRIESETGLIALYDGRYPDNNGWFVIREALPSGKEGIVLSWRIVPSVIPGWIRRPVILHAQIGYHPKAEKRILIERDPNDPSRPQAELLRITPEGVSIAYTAKPAEWGRYFRYDYAVFDVSPIRAPGLYRVRYGPVESHPFRITEEVFAPSTWAPTLDVFFPVQMCHMEVRDRFRIWHGACHLDDALQAPINHAHFDGYRSGPETETIYRPFEHVPSLDRGGWHDAGDDDLAGGSQIATVYALALTAECFNVRWDQTTILPSERLVILHQPDGLPDLLQQIAHGVEAILAGYRVAGHCFPGIISATIDQYVHVGDWSTMTDNRIYRVDGDSVPQPMHRRGAMDDRWVFTNRSTALEYAAVRALAAASRVLRSLDDLLARECLETALKAWTFEQHHEPALHRSAYIPGDPEAEKLLAAVELFLTTQDEGFLDPLVTQRGLLAEKIHAVGWSLVRILPFLEDRKLRKEFETLIRRWGSEAGHTANTPFELPLSPHIWGVGWSLQHFAFERFFLHRAFPERFDSRPILRVVDYMTGCHPASATSLVSGIGTHSLIPGYGINRDDWSYIPGGVASGVALIRPDFWELKEPWPYLWQQSEYVLSGAAEYLFLIHAARTLLEGME